MNRGATPHGYLIQLVMLFRESAFGNWMAVLQVQAAYQQPQSLPCSNSLERNAVAQKTMIPTGLSAVLLMCGVSDWLVDVMTDAIC